MIRLGTSGFSYDDWVGPVYPPELPKRDWLAHYASLFDTVELNVTYYRVPGRSTVEGWCRRTPDDFAFAVKAHSSLTHDRQTPDFDGFCAALAPAVGAGKLACVLAQFPQSFHCLPENRAYLARLRDGLKDLPVVTEFRHQSWVNQDAFELLRTLNLGYCCVDEPELRGLMPPIAIATSSPAYVRFHGRNAAKWWEHEHAWERYDYTYSADELKEWIPRLRALEHEAGLVLAYANNHYRGQSMQAMEQLKLLLS